MEHRVEDLLDVARAWDQAMIRNNPEAIGSFMGNDWIIIGPDGSVGTKAGFLNLIASGDLTHDVMTTEDPVVRFYGDTAVLTAHGVSSGIYKGQTFSARERSSCVFVKLAGRWQCVLTHLSSLSET